MDLQQYITATFGGNKAKFAAQHGVTPQQVSKWCANKYIIHDGVLFSPLRLLKQSTGSEEVTTSGKHAVNILVDLSNSLKRANSAFVSEFRAPKHVIKVEYQHENRYENLNKAIEDAKNVIEPFLMMTNYHSIHSVTAITKENNPDSCFAMLSIADVNKEFYVQDLYRDLLIYILRSKGFQATLA